MSAVRERAREQARARLGPFPPMSNEAADRYEDGYVDGFLAAYEQLPGRDEIARAIEAAFPVDQVEDTRNHLHGWYPTRSAAQCLADAVLSLLERGAE